ncbi:MAG: arginine--tRNA ligase [Eggerthellaceae bacterium]|nr:arginine--tRNA ligase [Eggerthellaceae bacterium]
MQIKEQLEHIVGQALDQCVVSGQLALDEVPAPSLERPRDMANGDWASTVAMRCSKAARKNPREIAKLIVDAIPQNDIIAATEIAGPGFINFRLTTKVLANVVADVREAGEDYGRSALPEPMRVNLEYVSANPTGPMHVGHGRWAALGDATARVMRHAGYDVYEEFYVNDHGVQMDVFGNSIAIRYLQLLGHDVELPENCYGGSYVTDIARGILERDGDKWENVGAKERLVAFRELGYKAMLQDVKDTLSRFGNHFSRFFSERSLYEPDEQGATAVDRALQAFRDKGYVYEDAGATWFASTAFGDEKDRVLIKENGEMTYFMSDCAYHYNKMQRNFDHLIDIWGADHHGYVKRCEAMLEAWGYPGALEVVLGQLVNLLRNGEPVRMSKRTGEMVTFKELIDEVGVDATRFLMLSRSSDQMIDFDIEEAKKQDASNPVYYVQYAHARICSILRKAEEMGIRIDSMDEADLGLLDKPEELALCTKMDEFTELIALAARERAPFKLTHYAQELASAFHVFYTNCRVIDEEPKIRFSRLALIDAVRTVLALTLSLLGVSAPSKM